MKNILSYSDQIAGRVNIFHILLLSLLLAASSIMFLKGGFLHPESSGYLPYYLSERPLLSKLYDSNILDNGCFQARELSYLFDFIDGKFIAFSISIGYPHFLSLTHYIFSILIGLIIWKFSVKQLGLSPLIGAGMVALFWTSPNVFFCNYYRSAKIGLALAIVILIYLIYKILRNEWLDKGYRMPLTDWLSCFGVAWCATLFDMQGTFMVGVITIFVLLWIIVFPGRNVLKLLIALAAGLLLNILYMYRIAPQLTFHLNHYWPNFSYQQLPLKQLIMHPYQYICYSSGLFIDTFRFLVGNISFGASIILTALILLTLFMLFMSIGIKMGSKNIKLALTIFAGLVISYLLIDLMIALMVLRLPLILRIDLRRTYFWLPITSVLCMTLAGILALFGRVRFMYKWVALTIIVIAVIGNICAIPQHAAILSHGFLNSSLANAPKLLSALRSLKDEHYLASPEIQRDIVYQHFRKSILPEGATE